MDEKLQFYAIQFIELPYADIDDYVWVPYTWIRVRKSTDGKVYVAYPSNEDPLVTRERAKRRERCPADWRLYLANIKYTSDTYEDTELWMAMRKKHGPFAEELEEDTVTGAPVLSNTPAGTVRRSPKRKCVMDPRMNAKRTTPNKPVNPKDITKQSSEPRENTPFPAPGPSNMHGTVSSQPTSEALSSGERRPSAQQPSMPIIDISDDEPPNVIPSPRETQPKTTHEIPPWVQGDLQTFLTADMDNLLKHPLVPLLKPVVKKSPLQNIKNKAAAAQNTSHLTNQTSSLEKHPIISPNNSQNLSRIPEMRTRNNVEGNGTDRGTTFRDIPNSTEEKQHEPRTNTSISHNVTAINPSLVLGNVANNKSPPGSQLSVPHPRPIQILDVQQLLPANEQGPTGPKLPTNGGPGGAIGPRQQLTAQQTPQAGIVSSQPLVGPPQYGLSNAALEENSQRIERMRDPRRRCRSKSIDSGRPFSDLLVQVNEAVTAQRQSNPAANQQPRVYVPRFRPPVNQDHSRQERQGQDISKSLEQNHSDHRPNSQTSGIRDPSVRIQNALNGSNQSHQNSELPQQELIQLPRNSQDAQQGQRRPEMSVNIVLERNNNMNMPSTVQGATNNSPVRVDSAYQSDEHMGRESPYYDTASSNEAVRDHHVVSDEEMSPDGPAEARNAVNFTGISSENNSAGSPAAAQNPAPVQAHPRHILEQQIFKDFTELFNQMVSMLLYVGDMHKNLQQFVQEATVTYQKMLLESLERFNAMGSSANTASASCSVAPGVPRADERPAGESERPYSCNETPAPCHNNPVNDAVNNNSSRIVLPPEYDTNDTRWTLRHRENAPGLVELMPDSRVYVSSVQLKRWLGLAKGCKSLAQLLLTEVFSHSALSVCLTISEFEEAQASNSAGSLRPALDRHACIVLLKFVVQQGFRRGLNPDIRVIIGGVDKKIQDMRIRATQQ